MAGIKYVTSLFNISDACKHFHLAVLCKGQKVVEEGRRKYATSLLEHCEIADDGSIMVLDPVHTIMEMVYENR